MATPKVPDKSGLPAVPAVRKPAARTPRTGHLLKPEMSHAQSPLTEAAQARWAAIKASLAR